jgi:hypothetical protein
MFFKGGSTSEYRKRLKLAALLLLKGLCPHIGDDGVARFVAGGEEEQLATVQQVESDLRDNHKYIRDAAVRYEKKEWRSSCEKGVSSFILDIAFINNIFLISQTRGESL